MSETNSAAPAAAEGRPAATAQEAHELLREVVQGRRLSREQASTVFAALGAGDLSEVETAALLAALHAAIPRMMRASPLMDGQGYVRAMEAAYDMIWERYLNEEA